MSENQPSGPTIEEQIAAVKAAEQFLENLWHVDGPTRKQLRAAAALEEGNILSA